MKRYSNGLYPVLTVKQPWAWALVLGPKTCENRPWRVHYRGWVWINAGMKKPLRDAIEAIERILGHAPPEDLTTGAVIGRVWIDDCLDYPGGPTSDLAVDPWACGPRCWMIGDRVALETPVPCVGRLGLWTPGAELAAKLAAAQTI